MAITSAMGMTNNSLVGGGTNLLSSVLVSVAEASGVTALTAGMTAATGGGTAVNSDDITTTTAGPLGLTSASTANSSQHQFPTITRHQEITSIAPTTTTGVIDGYTKTMAHHSTNDRNNNNNIVTKRPVLMIFILGGLTYLEIAAFRHLAKDPMFPYEIVLASTCLTNGTKFLKTFHPTSSNLLNTTTFNDQ